MLSRGGPLGSLIDPGSQQPDLFVSQPITFGWHDAVGVDASNSFNQRTLGALSNDDRQSALASGHRVVAAIQSKSGFLSRSPVTLMAPLAKYGKDIFCKIDVPIRRGRNRGRILTGRSKFRQNSARQRQDDDDHYAADLNPIQIIRRAVHRETIHRGSRILEMSHSWSRAA